ncbi:MAG: fatty acid desaturase [Planctomycetota bacterium]|jgi:fatty acid desaturase|nr:fatty acid desaturase [Planctomycetota bacterium]
MSASSVCGSSVEDPVAETGEAGWISDARRVIRDSPTDFFAVRPVRYWADFLISMVLAYSCATIYLLAPLGSWPQLLAFPVAVFWLYRLGSLIHEVCHLGHNEMRAFKVVWNLFVGTMTLTPSPFFTRHHRDHHSARMYGTPEDPEYVANVLEAGNLQSALGYAAFILLFPIIVFLRFLLAPLTFISPALRQLALERASSLTLNLRYQRHVTPFDRWAITMLEIPCFIRAAMIPTTILLGFAPPSRVVLLYVLALTTVILNQLRQLADHHFAGDGVAASWEDHILDSCNFTGRDPLTWLFFPFSIRYHALHHLFPSMPYHNLKPAHEYLVQTLPKNSPYLGLDQPGWWSVARRTVFGPVAV